MAKTRRNLMAVVATAAVLFAADPTMAGERPETRIVLHVADYSQLPPAVLARAQAEVATIYDRIGVDVVWMGTDCSENHAHKFTVVILSREMGLKMISTDGVRETVMGKAAKETGRAYIFTHRVRDTSARHGIDFQKFLGKVLAHEVGHLLLTNGHSEFGIMQPAMQVRTDASEWFTPAQGATIRAELAGAANGN